MTVYDLVKNQISAKPDQFAVRFGNNELKYRQLDEEVNKMSSYLLGSGIKRGDIVGISVNRSIEMVVTLLGIIKIGAIYIPLDPDFPANRLKYMLEDSECKFLVTENSLKESFNYYNGNILVVENYKSFQATDFETDLIDDKSVVYILYTSGSTGNPKGVQITHESLVNFLLSMQKTPGLSEKDILLAITTLSFDISGLEIYLPLITGAQLIVASKEETKDGGLLLEKVKNASVMQATPSTWKLLLEAGWNQKLNLKALCGGEALTRDLADKLLDRVDVLWNMYGPTETTIWSSCSKVEPGDSIIHLGRPIANTQFYIVDKNNRFCPPGIAGELLIGGKGLSVGYFKREQLTSEKFILNPFDKEQKTKVYKTGDLVRLTPKKELEFLGRIDSQVKIRGFRIELGEIETLIMHTDLVKDCTVVVKEFNDNDKKIVAFYLKKEHLIGGNGSGSSTSEQQIIEQLRNKLKDKLPEYMLPSYFIKLDSFPLTPNNKVDRKELSKFDISELVIHHSSIKPQTIEEKIFVQIWEKLLGIQNIGIDDNFFELGGHSILAAQMFTEFEKLTGKKVPLATLFTSQTIKELSIAINDNGTESKWSSLVEIKSGESKLSPLFLVHGAEGNILLYRDLGNYLNSNRPVYGLQSKGLNGYDKIAESVEEMAEDYIEAIKTVRPNGPYYLGGYCMGGTIAYEMAQQLKKRGDEVNILFLIETYNECLVANGNNPSNKAKDRIENIKFHFDNIKSLKGEERTKFIRNKAETSLGRTTARISKLTSKVGINIENKPETGQITLSLRKANDQAQINYIPDIFNGKAVLLRPKVSFSSEPDPKFGWGEYIKGEFKIYNLDVAPRGMLVDPFVKETAKIIENEFNN
jgi:amino acid adenylation domain-containing protein